MSDETDNIEAKLCAFLDGELPEGERAEIEKYLAANPQQAHVMRELRSARKWMAGLPKENAPAEVMEAVQAVLERGALLEGAGEDVGRRGFWGRWPGALAMAAVVMLVVGLGAVLYQVFWPGGVDRRAEYATNKTPPATTMPEGVAAVAEVPTTRPGERTALADSGTFANRTGDELTLAKKVGPADAAKGDADRVAMPGDVPAKEGESAFGVGPSLALGPPAPAVARRPEAAEENRAAGEGIAGTAGTSVVGNGAATVPAETGTAVAVATPAPSSPAVTVAPPAAAAAPASPGTVAEAARDESAVGGQRSGSEGAVEGRAPGARIEDAAASPAQHEAPPVVTMVVTGVEGQRRVVNYLEVNRIKYTRAPRGEAVGGGLAASQPPAVFGGNPRGMSDRELMQQKAMTKTEAIAPSRRLAPAIEELIVATVPATKVQELARTVGASGPLSGPFDEQQRGAGGAVSNAVPITGELLGGSVARNAGQSGQSGAATTKDATVETRYFPREGQDALKLDAAAAAAQPAEGVVRVEVICRPGGAGAVRATAPAATTKEAK